MAFSSTSSFGCIAVFELPNLTLVDQSYARSNKVIPYVPTFLSYREIPVIMRAYKALKIKPDLILVDGQGIAHPRSLGLASHLGVLLDKPTIGCAKSHLFGDYQSPGKKKGSLAGITSGRKKLGIVLRTKDETKPLFISPGHLVGHNDCRKYVLLSTTRYRIPEPIRSAHRMAGEMARKYG